jgi:WD40 repeat protein
VGVAFSPDGKTIASASSDRTVRRWDTRTGQPIGQPLTGHTGPVKAIAFSPDGTMIASANMDRTVRLWPVSINIWIQHACALAKRNMRQEEWKEFMSPDSPYVRTCPNLPAGHGAPVDAPAATYHFDS